VAALGVTPIRWTVAKRLLPRLLPRIGDGHVVDSFLTIRDEKNDAPYRARTGNRNNKKNNSEVLRGWIKKGMPKRWRIVPKFVKSIRTKMQHTHDPSNF
jgi:hypothetical protein